MNSYEIFLLVIAGLILVQALLFWSYVAYALVENWFSNKELKRILNRRNVNLRA